MEYRGIPLRHELKYLISYHEYSYLETRLASMLKMDENSVPEEGYHIRSLYFDDIYNSALEEKESGIQFRRKYRIRIYDKSDSKINLERKEKFSDLISKSSVGLSKEQFYSIIKNDDSTNITDISNYNGRKRNNANSDVTNLLREFYTLTRIVLLRPAVIVDYSREVFVMREGNVRITFDKNLSAGINTADIFSDDIIGISAIEPGLMIMEVKYDDYLPTQVQKLLQIAGHERSALSKYVMCRKAQLSRNSAAIIS